MSQFKIGESAMFVRHTGKLSDAAEPYHGQVVTIVDGPLSKPSPPYESFVGNVGYLIRASDGFQVEVGEVCLRKIEPPPQREELGEWELCPWQPKHLEVRT
jgi:hypothetical protein